MITADAPSDTTVQRRNDHGWDAPQPTSGPSSADRLMLHVIVGLVLGAAFSVTHENWLMIIVGGALGVLFGSTGTVLDRRRS